MKSQGLVIEVFPTWANGALAKKVNEHLSSREDVVSLYHLFRDMNRALKL